MLLPELETSIENLLDTLECLDVRLQKLCAPTSSRAHELREAMRRQVRGIYDARRSTFDHQRSHLRELAAISPLTSPVMSPVLSKRLAAALRSPPNSPPQSPQHSRPHSPVSSTTASPTLTQRSPPRELPLDAVSPPSGDDEFVLLEDDLGRGAEQFPIGRVPFGGVLFLPKGLADSPDGGSPSSQQIDHPICT